MLSPQNWSMSFWDISEVVILYPSGMNTEFNGVYLFLRGFIVIFPSVELQKSFGFLPGSQYAKQSLKTTERSFFPFIKFT